MSNSASAILVPDSHHAEAILAAVPRRVAAKDREKFTEDLTEVFYARSEAHGLRAFWELAARWERFYPTVVEMIERKLHGASSFVASV